MIFSELMLKYILKDRHSNHLIPYDGCSFEVESTNRTLEGWNVVLTFMYDDHPEATWRDKADIEVSFEEFFVFCYLSREGCYEDKEQD